MHIVVRKIRKTLKISISCLVYRGRVGQVENLYVSLCCSDYHQWVGYIQTITTFGESNRGYRVLTPDIPVLLPSECMLVLNGMIVSNLDCLIPTSGNNYSTAGGIDVLADTDRAVVFCDLSGLTGLNIVHSACAVGSR